MNDLKTVRVRTKGQNSEKENSKIPLCTDGQGLEQTLDSKLFCSLQPFTPGQCAIRPEAGGQRWKPHHENAGTTSAFSSTEVVCVCSELQINFNFLPKRRASHWLSSLNEYTDKHTGK